MQGGMLLAFRTKTSVPPIFSCRAKCRFLVDHGLPVDIFIVDGRFHLAQVRYSPSLGYNHEYREKSTVRIWVSSVGPRTSDPPRPSVRGTDMPNMWRPGSVLVSFRTSSPPERTERHKGRRDKLAGWV
jgi:hypothetical protein